VRACLVGMCTTHGVCVCVSPQGLLHNLTQAWGAANSPIIAFGGSYGGMLAAWMRRWEPAAVGAASDGIHWSDVSVVVLFVFFVGECGREAHCLAAAQPYLNTDVQSTAHQHWCAHQY
jgi:hypothetical protein